MFTVHLTNSPSVTPSPNSGSFTEVVPPPVAAAAVAGAAGAA